MEDRNVSIPSVGTRYGLYSAAAFIVYFLLMRALDLIQYPGFRFLNYIFLIGAILLAFSFVRNHIHKHRLNYLPGLALGLWVTVICAAVFGVFMLVYCKLIDPGFLNRVGPHLPFSEYLNSWVMAFEAASETLVFGIIISFVCINLFKRNRAPENEAEEEAAEGKIFHRNPSQQPPTKTV